MYERGLKYGYFDLQCTSGIAGVDASGQTQGGGPGVNGCACGDGHGKAVAERADSCAETTRAAPVTDCEFAGRLGVLGGQRSWDHGGEGRCSGSGCSAGRAGSRARTSSRQGLTVVEHGEIVKALF